MKLLWFMLCLTCYSSLGNSQENEEAAALQKDLQDFVRRLNQQQLHTTQNMGSPLLPQLHLPLSRPPFEPNEDLISSPSGFNFPFQSRNDGREGARTFASSFSSVKRPHESGEARSEAVAYASVKDVNNEERLGEDMESEKTSTVEEPHRTSPSHMDTTLGSSSERTGPYPLKQQQLETVIKKEDSFSDVYFVAIVAGCCAVGIFGVISAGVCFYRLQKSRKAAADVDYPAYGVTGPCKDISSPNGDRKLAQSAQMYHYQHQKQQMIAVEKAGSTKNTSASDVDSEEENEEGDYTVYECPGLAPTGEMEVKNPLFHDDSTPMSPPLPAKSDDIHNN